MKSFRKHIRLFTMAMMVLFVAFVALGFVAVPESAFALPIIGLTTLAANTPRAKEGGDINEIPVIAADIIYEGAAVGIVDGTGHARPLNAADRFAGFAEAKADNSAVRAVARMLVITDKGSPALSAASHSLRSRVMCGPNKRLNPTKASK